MRNALYLQTPRRKVTVLEVAAMRDRFPEEYAAFQRRGGLLISSLPKRPHFEVVIATFVIETICDPTERRNLVQSIRRCLKSGGAFILSVRGPRDLLTAKNKGKRCNDGFITPNRSFARAYTRRQLNDFLGTMGFSRLDFLHKPSSKAPEYLHVIAWK